MDSVYSESDRPKQKKYMDPITQFKNWYQHQLDNTTRDIPSACCLSTIGLDDFPNARYVSLKGVVDSKFVVTGPLLSRKGQELSRNPVAALTFWWPETSRQIRMQGRVTPIDESLANTYFEGRSTASKIVSLVSRQGQETEQLDALKATYEHTLTSRKGHKIQRPENWGGFFIDPIRMEFMNFRNSRFHERTLAIKNEEGWVWSEIQP